MRCSKAMVEEEISLSSLDTPLQFLFGSKEAKQLSLSSILLRLLSGPFLPTKLLFYFLFWFLSRQAIHPFSVVIILLNLIVLLCDPNFFKTMTYVMAEKNFLSFLYFH